MRVKEKKGLINIVFLQGKFTANVGLFLQMLLRGNGRWTRYLLA